MRQKHDPLQGQPFGYYWEVVHSKSGEVVNSGFQRFHLGDEPPEPEVKSSLEGYVVRSVAVYRDAPALQAAVRDLLDILTSKKPGTFNEAAARVEALLPA